MALKYRPEIDGLRALAVVPVILYHAGLRAFSGGFVGVDVFFVISGYLITSIIITEKQAGTFKLLRFYERRARRILPALFTVIFALLPFAWLWLLPEDMKSFSESLVAVCTFSSNVLFFLKSGYFDASADFIPLLHTWSLAVEEQYYMLFPIFLLLIWKLKRRWIITIFAVVAIVSLGAACLFLGPNPSFAFFLLPTRAWEILIGVIAAFHLNSNDSRHNTDGYFCEIASLTGLLLILYAVFCFSKQTPFPGFYALIPTIGAALIIIFSSDRTFVGRLLQRKVVVGIGLISYSAYLWHHPLFVFLRHRNLNEPSLVLTASLVLATAVLAYLTWKYVEMPFRDRLCISGQNIFRYATLCSSIFIMVGFIGYVNNGYTKRPAPSCLPVNYFESAMVRRVALEGVDGNRCISEKASMGKVHNEPGGKKILLVGDSHSGDYSFEFQKFVIEKKLNAWQFSVGGCAFLPSQSDGECGKAKRLLEKAIEKTKFDQIIFIGHFYGHTRLSDHKVVRQDIDSLLWLVRHMLQSDARVVFFTPRYSLTVDPMRAAMINEVNRITVVKEASADCVDSQLKELANAANLTIFNERDALLQLGCGDVKCFNGHTPDLKPLYRDTNHLTNLGAKLVFQQLTSSLIH